MLKCAGRFCFYGYMATRIPFIKTYSTPHDNISNCTLYVPQGTKEAYANADVWKDFGNIIEYDATGIDKVTNRSDVKEITRYSLNGQRVTSPTKGVNIVVYSDGSIKKVAVQ